MPSPPSFDEVLERFSTVMEDFFPDLYDDNLHEIDDECEGFEYDSDPDVVLCDAVIDDSGCIRLGTKKYYASEGHDCAGDAVVDDPPEGDVIEYDEIGHVQEGGDGHNVHAMQNSTGALPDRYEEGTEKDDEAEGYKDKERDVRSLGQIHCEESGGCSDARWAERVGVFLNVLQDFFQHIAYDEFPVWQLGGSMSLCNVETLSCKIPNASRLVVNFEGSTEAGTVVITSKNERSGTSDSASCQPDSAVSIPAGGFEWTCRASNCEETAGRTKASDEYSLLVTPRYANDDRLTVMQRRWMALQRPNLVTRLISSHSTVCGLGGAAEEQGSAACIQLQEIDYLVLEVLSHLFRVDPSVASHDKVLDRVHREVYTLMLFILDGFPINQENGRVEREHVAAARFWHGIYASSTGRERIGARHRDSVQLMVEVAISNSYVKASDTVEDLRGQGGANALDAVDESAQMDGTVREPKPYCREYIWDTVRSFATPPDSWSEPTRASARAAAHASRMEFSAPDSNWRVLFHVGIVGELVGRDMHYLAYKGPGPAEFQVAIGCYGPAARKFGRCLPDCCSPQRGYQLFVSVCIGGTTTMLQPHNVFLDSTRWFHICVSFDGFDVTILVDGEVVLVEMLHRRVRLKNSTEDSLFLCGGPPWVDRPRRQTAVIFVHKFEIIRGGVLEPAVVCAHICRTVREAWYAFGFQPLGNRALTLPPPSFFVGLQDEYGFDGREIVASEDGITFLFAGLVAPIAALRVRAANALLGLVDIDVVVGMRRIFAVLLKKNKDGTVYENIFKPSLLAMEQFTSDQDLALFRALCQIVGRMLSMPERSGDADCTIPGLVRSELIHFLMTPHREPSVQAARLPFLTEQLLKIVRNPPNWDLLEDFVYKLLTSVDSVRMSKEFLVEMMNIEAFEIRQRLADRLCELPHLDVLVRCCVQDGDRGLLNTLAQHCSRRYFMHVLFCLREEPCVSDSSSSAWSESERALCDEILDGLGELPNDVVGSSRTEACLDLPCCAICLKPLLDSPSSPQAAGACNHRCHSSCLEAWPFPVADEVGCPLCTRLPYDFNAAATEEDGGGEGECQYLYCDDPAENRAFHALRNGWVQLLSAQWLVHRPRHYVIQRCQDLPQDAFSVNFRCRWDEDGGLLALSYGWITRAHPDPHGWHLHRLQQYLRAHLESSFFKIDDAGTFWDYASLPQNHPKTGKKTEEETKQFKRGLKVINLIYGLPKTIVVQLKAMPALWRNPPRAYDSRGWCFFEEQISSILKANDRLLDLSLAARALEQGAGQDTVQHEATVARKPPLHPDAFELALQDKVFTNGADRKMVCNTYRSFFLEVCARATVLQFSSQGAASAWGPDDASTLALSLPLFRSCEQLCLGGHDFGDDGLATLARALPSMRELLRLELRSCLFGETGLEALNRVIERGAMPPRLAQISLPFSLKLSPAGSRTSALLDTGESGRCSVLWH